MSCYVSPGKPDDVHAMHKAGYAVTYDKFQFITVNGAGHMVSYQKDRGEGPLIISSASIINIDNTILNIL